MAYGTQYVHEGMTLTVTRDLHPLVEGEEVKVIHEGVMQTGWIVKVRFGGTYEVRCSSGARIVRDRGSIA